MSVRLGQVNTTTRPTATRVIDGSDFHVELDLDGVADTLLDQIAAVLYRERRTWELSMLGNPKTGAAQKARMRNAIKAALIADRAFDVPLYTTQAQELSTDLWGATEAPTPCTGECGGENYATRDDGLCDVDGSAADRVESGLSHLRSVS
jgi:hypothetical protein